MAVLLRDSSRCGRQCGGCGVRVWSSCQQYARSQLVRHIRRDHAGQLANAATVPVVRGVASAVVGAQIAPTVVWNGGVWDIDKDRTWFYRKRWLGLNVASTFANLSQSQAVALLEGFCSADGEWAGVQFVGQADVARKEPTGQWRCTNSSFPLIDHLQLIGQLAGARVQPGGFMYQEPVRPSSIRGPQRTTPSLTWSITGALSLSTSPRPTELCRCTLHQTRHSWS